MTEIKRLSVAAAIEETAKQTAIAIFEALGAAEAKIHNVDIEKIHFHEVGAVDAMVDIVCAAVGAEALGVDELCARRSMWAVERSSARTEHYRFRLRRRWSCCRALPSIHRACKRNW